MDDKIREAVSKLTMVDLLQSIETCELPKIKTPKIRYTSNIEVYEEWEVIETVRKESHMSGWHPIYAKGKLSNIGAYKPETVGYLYFVFLDGLTKIGKASNIETRLKQLANGGHSLDVIFIAHLYNYDKWEKWFHKLFADKRVSGEWFHTQQADIDFAKSLIMKLTVEPDSE